MSDREHYLDQLVAYQCGLSSETYSSEILPMICPVHGETCKVTYFRAEHVG